MLLRHINRNHFAYLLFHITRLFEILLIHFMNCTIIDEIKQRIELTTVNLKAKITVIATLYLSNAHFYTLNLFKLLVHKAQLLFILLFLVKHIFTNNSLREIIFLLFFFVIFTRYQIVSTY